MEAALTRLMAVEAGANVMLGEGVCFFFSSFFFFCGRGEDLYFAALSATRLKSKDSVRATNRPTGS